MKISKMPPLTSHCDPNVWREATSSPINVSEFIQSAVLRPLSEIQAEYEKVWQAHWRVIDARIHGRPAPDGLDEEVIQERHYGFGWVVQGFDWDHVSIDT